MKKNRKGFTLVELIAVIVVIAIISTIAIVSYTTITQRTKEKEYDALVEKVQLCTDPSEAIEYIKEADEIVGNDYVFLNLYYKNGTSLMHPYVQGVYINASQMMYLKTASVNK